jgi:molybdopterin-guanine dinucleotide biosynthesis protein A
MDRQNKVAGVILAGGLARRMQQQDKGLVLLNGKAMVSYAIDAMKPLVDILLINANRNQGAYQQWGYEVIADQTLNFDGPLAGMLAAMKAVNTEWLLVMPCDSPLIKTAHIETLLKTAVDNDCDCAVAFDGERIHPVFLALKTCLKSSLEDYLARGERKIDRWLFQHDCARVDFRTQAEVFRNINTPEQLAQVEAMLNAD